MTDDPLRPVDPTERAHLRDAVGFSPPVHRFAPPATLADVVRRFWVPVWSLGPGEVTEQRVLQYPVCLVVIASDYARLVGPVSGLSVKSLRGSGWAVGVMLQPAAGSVLLGAPVSTIVDGVRDLTSIDRVDDALVQEIHRTMAPDPADPLRQERAAALLSAALGAASTGLLPVDEEGALVNDVVAYIESDVRVHRVGQVCEKFALTERSLQRLLARRVGMRAKWLIQRRRLHEAAERLRSGARPDLARVAADLGYADQAHFSHDWRAVTGTTPGGFAAEPVANGP